MIVEEYNQEGFISFRGYKTWYGIVGDPALPDPGKFPVLTLHGLPVSHESLEPLGKLIETGRPVIFYDQLGCGKSDQPEDESIWSMALFAEQLATVRQQLDLDHVHLFGHSFGGMIMMEYLNASPKGLISLTFHSTPVNLPLYSREWDRLIGELPSEVQETMAKHEAEGTLDDPAYLKARNTFDTKHIWRLDPLPDYLQRSLENMSIADIDIEQVDYLEQLDKIDLPTLITSGEYDTVTPMMAEMQHNGIKGSQWELFDDCSHYAHAEQPELYLSVLDAFLSQVETERLSKEVR